MERGLDKYLYKLFIGVIKAIPMLLAFNFAIMTILAYYEIDIFIFHYLGGVSFLTLVFLYLASYTLKFCSYHRVPLHYIVVSNLFALYSTYSGFPEEDSSYIQFQAAIFILFVLLYIIKKKGYGYYNS